MNKTALLALMMLPLFVVGCSKRSTLGTVISSQGAEIAAIGDKWSEGDELVETGEDQIERGNDMIAKGRKLIREGEDNIDLGNEMKSEAEKDYRTRTGKDLPTPD